MDHFVLDETIHSRSALGLWITERPALPAAERVVQHIEVDGREGTLTILKGWRDCEIPMKAALLGADIRGRYRNVQTRLREAKTMYRGDDPTVYYKVKTVEIGPLYMKLSQLGEFTVNFTCAPFQYLRNVAQMTRTASGSLTNPGTMYSLPKITVYGTGTRTLTINGKAIILNLLPAHLILDSEIKECYFGNTAQNNLMTGDFPVLEPGSNVITLGTGITKIEIEPRWRFL